MRAKRRQAQVLLGIWGNARRLRSSFALGSGSGTGVVAEAANNFSDDWTHDQVGGLDNRDTWPCLGGV